MAIHPTAIIHRGAEIDPTTEIGPYCVIDSNVRIGANCRLFHNVFVTGWTQIADGCTIHPGAIVGHEPQDVKYKGERSYCRLGKNGIIREYVTIHRGTEPESTTAIGDNCFLLSGSHIAHNCSLGNNITLINGVLLAGHVHIGDRVTMGGGATVHQFVRIGELAMIAGNARVPMDVLPFAMLDVSGRVIGLNRIGMRRSGLTRDDLHAIREAYRTLHNSGLPFRKAVEKLTLQASASPAVSRLVQFLSEPSKRGIAGKSRGAQRTLSEAEAN